MLKDKIQRIQYEVVYPESNENFSNLFIEKIYKSITNYHV